jgi:oxygen-independent coproporphyrinogen-3 oxidase
MGYTTTNTELLIGLGASAISDAKYAYAQNEKKVEEYLGAIQHNASAIVKGHIHTDEDLLVKQCILQISCQGELSRELMMQVTDANILNALLEMEKEGILFLYEDGGLKVTTAGEPFIRNICRVFDKRMNEEGNHREIFSKAI